jgi:hypothetical protein
MGKEHGMGRRAASGGVASGAEAKEGSTRGVRDVSA